ncbi:GMP synthase (glutamine-hydrolyzing) [Halanaerobium congolense]|jgi:GMP synthase (glutamine-hydrolysing)|uniref:GMP synthase [glutamine-hydrolyzing] n=1 Tax=Halanaerobium congolense TaxID=54121 RepID=A0A1G6PY46_9FIRM|nr:glutamine-hydrolyzing GMP synthase [Halanaerobium congolense]KXS49615.1 MAG: GMP synthase (glutamine-hydrolysing) [Halanaerobium sp. T82-1]PTX15484.1 LOW QUALITY PROTEIN: GMP synthase (glutamine-hydrolysing) [Halanaerobium congolense]SDC85132.1 GMP synthase (glutamine-hydrolyzing) [Halanaerobium congolense]SDF04116.1 GMP synthase (glutamine-hydrolyzing) [Halanaerobium congolense]SES73003.1 GMP synthase (glutamine-hydrolyzing) [Halanaerobium congolense]
MDYEKILILDFGGQYSQLIARRVREFNVYSVIRGHDIELEEIKKIDPAAIIFSGGPDSVTAPKAPGVDQGVFELGIPILGICYGMQLMAQLLEAGQVEKAEHGEYGKANLELFTQKKLFKEIDNYSQVWMSHGDHVKKVPAGFEIIAKTELTEAAAMADFERDFYGVQFHPEVNHTIHGKTILHNFLFRIVKVKANWNMSDYINEEVERIRSQVGTGKVICGLSGGVDSAVASAIVHKAIGDQLTCIFVDHGLLRKGEAEQVKRTFGEEFNIPLIYVDAKKRFLDRLAGVKDPEEKRKIIGDEFIQVFDEEAETLSDVRYLVQGTIYSDVIESGGTDKAATIKSHHNVGGLPEEMNLELVEPLHFLFKDEVRKIGEVLGLPEEIVWRQPFPGPGLAIRIIGDVDWDKLETLRNADAIVQEEIRDAGLYRDIWQSFAVLPDLRSVGVMGDERTYGYPIILRAVNSDDAMTADWARLPYELMQSISNRIVNQVEEVNRVVYDITSKPPGTIEWE